MNARDVTSLPYRPCVGVMLLNDAGRVFVARRIDTPDAWQMPQGGIDTGEKPKQAAFRELKEEIGTDNATMLAKTEGWLTYDLPDHLVGKVFKGKYRGQKQKWFAMRFQGADSEINLDGHGHHAEFDAWQWVEMHRLPELIVPFKRDVYRHLVEIFGHLAKAD